MNPSKIANAVKVNNRRIDIVIIKIGIALLTYGLLLPNDWRQMLGSLSLPVIWMAESIPSVKKAAEISPIHDLVLGFFGGAFLLLPLFVTMIVVKDSLGRRFGDSLDRATSKLKFLGAVYLLGVPALVLVLYLVYVGPRYVHLGITPTRGQAFLSLMISYRITLALFGSLFLMGICATLWSLIFNLAGPFVYYFKRKNHHGE